MTRSSRFIAILRRSLPAAGRPAARRQYSGAAVGPVLDDLSGVVERDGGDASLGQCLAVVGLSQVLLDRRRDLGVEHDAFFDAEFTDLELTRQRCFHPPA